MEKKKNGRPRKLTERDYEIVRRMAKLGMSMKITAESLGIDDSTAFRDSKFCDLYKEEYRECGAKVRAKLLAKSEEGDITASIYLDKVINKSTEKSHDDNIEMKRKQFEMERKRAEWK